MSAVTADNFGLDEILKDPSAVYADPCEVLCQSKFPAADKTRILQQWRYDLVQLQVAAGENLIGDSGGAGILRKIDDCLRELRS